MGKTYRTEYWGAGNTALFLQHSEGLLGNKNYREGLSDLPSRASLRRCRDKNYRDYPSYVNKPRKVDVYVKPEARSRVHRRKVDVADH